jgi:predicted nucleic acid-binding protein
VRDLLAQSVRGETDPIEEMLECALLLMQTASISFWDAVIVVSASEAGCSVLLTEDLNAGQIIAGVLIRNPFLKPLS